MCVCVCVLCSCRCYKAPQRMWLRKQVVRCPPAICLDELLNLSKTQLPHPLNRSNKGASQGIVLRPELKQLRWPAGCVACSPTQSGVPAVGIAVCGLAQSLVWAPGEQGRGEVPVGLRGRPPGPVLVELGQRGGGGPRWARPACVGCQRENETIRPQVFASTLKRK